ncbi:hypothetical protein CcI156_16435 [Frankia sp. CcI156]|uniref:Uncharacterized protein n=1 Tax=Frankia casuarinae (strain DSM 45818 / CECT 9043 / HFP020203 / CcI3) TaxID=106370 RepID=Q2J6F7_FRACC|nr:MULTISPECIES: hypothetical protein [Frankia]ABD13135.1 hypothetical protein Francci3_3784 [Frankia casuarinae]ETA01296.1 hypothetical protein CcI6DRAFT_03295 [Frankia sp. CcI6]EYT90830.1 hypothetical protein ThrDRAFT_03542 [Frankia casuarinae]KDA42040.1 hypothetical protein BMG523Draft_03155 [Frankia sp. BMG5.23]KEZ36323.1 hypothetical protein CEDDRAFT_02345 [Frankia sp. CeD]
MWFLLIPPVAVLITLAWVTLRSRPDRTSEAMITIEGYRRSMAALARPIPAQHEVRTVTALDEPGHPGHPGRSASAGAPLSARHTAPPPESI